MSTDDEQWLGCVAEAELFSDLRLRRRFGVMSVENPEKSPEFDGWVSDCTV